MANRSMMSMDWVVWAFLMAWLAGGLYVCLLAVHLLLGVPWYPVLSTTKVLPRTLGS
jgi:hypothetical protein